MSYHHIVLGRTFQGREAATVQTWLNAFASKGWEFVTVMPVVEPNHGMYVFRCTGDVLNEIDESCTIPELSPELTDH